MAILAGALLVLAILALNIGETYIRDRFEGMRRKAYFDSVISGKGLSLKEAQYWKPRGKGEK